MKKIGCYEIMVSYWCLIVLIDINRSWSRSRSQSRFILEGSEPEPPKIGRLRNMPNWVVNLYYLEYKLYNRYTLRTIAQYLGK